MAGRKTKFNPLLQEEIENNLKLGCTVKVTCELAGISQETFFQWKKTNPEFLEAVTRAEASAHRAATAAVRANLNSTQSVVVETETFIETRLRKTKDGDVPYEYTKTTTTRREITSPPDWRAGMEYLKRRERDSWSDKTQTDITTDGKPINVSFNSVPARNEPPS